MLPFRLGRPQNYSIATFAALGTLVEAILFIAFGALQEGEIAVGLAAGADVLIVPEMLRLDVREALDL